MITVLSWYVVITLLGALAWPLLFRLVPGLPDRGYTLSRALGLMLTGYVFWLLGSLGFLRNTLGGIIFSALVVFGFAWWAYLTRSDHSETMRGWLKTHQRTVLVAELLFAIAFLGWVIVRSYNPEIVGTEKPMELTFLNGVRSSPVFPPRDPWLSNYAISYYYFGYILIALIADLTGTASAVAFNLGIALLFALTLLGSYGIVFNLVASRRAARTNSEDSDSTRLPLTALLGPIFVGVMGNLAGLLELLRALRLPSSAAFWSFVDLEDLERPVQTVLWPPDRWRFWWWWRASRVIRDRYPAGHLSDFQPIDEFPMFSFLLGDMHPHVLALPFVLLALGLALNVLLQRDRLSRPQFALYTLCFGALAFLNTWDLPIYLFILVGAMIVREIRERGAFEWADLRRPLLAGIGIFVAGIIAYLPWYISFSSQAGGILPNALFPTRLHQFSIMFGPFLLIVLWFLIDRAIRHRKHMSWNVGLTAGVLIFVTLFAVMSAMGIVGLRTDPGVRSFVAASVDTGLQGQPDDVIMQQIPQLASTILVFRLLHPLTALLLTGIIVLCTAALLPRERPPETDDEEPVKASINPANAFAMILIVTAALLTLGPEFVYLRDVFGQRLNTVFKFYYAAWILFAVAAAYAAHELFSGTNRLRRYVFTSVLIILVVAGMIYPVLAIPNKANDFASSEQLPTLNGISYILQEHPGDYAAIQWLQQNAQADDVLLEAVGGQYSYYGRFSMATGIPAVMGWPGHERQWRGDRYPELAGTREQDIREIYNTPNMRRALELLQKYGVTYIMVGSLERSPDFATPAGLVKFDRYLPIVFQDQNVLIYRADQTVIEDEEAAP
jgi:YYY domain-containing protein